MFCRGLTGELSVLVTPTRLRSRVAVLCHSEAASPSSQEASVLNTAADDRVRARGLGLPQLGSCIF